jgi:hypothetical protein
MQAVSHSPLPSTISRKTEAALLHPTRLPDQRIRVSAWLNAGEWIIVGLLALIAISLHLRFVTHVGGLWRDEANSVQVATLPTVQEAWRCLEFDSFPILFFGILRGWTGIFGADSDGAFRALGLVVGLGILATLLINVRTLRAGWPVLSFALVGLNPMLIRYGDSTRAYGLGILLLLFTFRSFWRLVDSPSSPGYRKIVSSALLAVLSVQCLYYNSVLLFAICAGAIAVAIRIRAWRTIGIILVIGLIAAISLLPYLPMIRRMHEWTFLVNYPIDLAWLWRRVCEVTGSPDPIGIWLWAGLCVVVFLLTVGLAWRRSVAVPVLYAGVTCLVAIPAYAVFLRVLSYYTQPWYYITLTILVASTFDIIFGAWDEQATISKILRSLRLVIAIGLICLAGLPAWEEMPTRHTNVDLVAARLRLDAAKDDLIVTSHWQYAVSLCRYYHGPAKIMTLPPIDDHRFHRYDLALWAMKNPEPFRPAASQMEKTLRGGHKVFIVGGLPPPRPGVPPPRVSLGYRQPDGMWHGGNYDAVWPVLAGYFVYAHAARYTQIPIPVPNRERVQRHEHLALTLVEGWR